MSAKLFSAALTGLDAQIIEIEADVSYGLRSFTIVGLPDKAVEESKERVGAALKSAGFSAPHTQPHRVLINLAPADLKKEGALYDLPIALGYLAASKQLNTLPASTLVIGELALDGTLRPVKGVFPLVLAAEEKGYTELILPQKNALEASLVTAYFKGRHKEPITIIGASSLKTVIGHLKGTAHIAPCTTSLEAFLQEPTATTDFSWIKGQESSKRALEIAAAGGHNILMQGPPGTGKSILAKALPSILPTLDFEEALEVTKIYSVVGRLPAEKPLINIRPFRAPHHSTSEVALIGGGSPPKPGEITLAHRGVLFLDEFPEFHRDVLESLRQPLEEGSITVLRARHHVTFPARFSLVAAANPCPCGFYRDPKKACQCTPSQIAMYRRKLSGPLIDRIDLVIAVPAIKFDKLVVPESDTPSSESFRKRIDQARAVQKERLAAQKQVAKARTEGRSPWRPSGTGVNADMIIPDITTHCAVDVRSQAFLKKFVDAGKLSARGYHRVLKVARTIADLEAAQNISYDHITEALMYRIREG